MDEIREIMGADSLGYLSLEGLRKYACARSSLKHGFCDACFSDELPRRAVADAEVRPSSRSSGMGRAWEE